MPPKRPVKNLRKNANRNMSSKRLLLQKYEKEIDRLLKIRKRRKLTRNEANKLQGFLIRHTQMVTRQPFSDYL